MDEAHSLDGGQSMKWYQDPPLQDFVVYLTTFTSLKHRRFFEPTCETPEAQTNLPFPTKATPGLTRQSATHEQREYHSLNFLSDTSVQSERHGQKVGKNKIRAGMVLQHKEVAPQHWSSWPFKVRTEHSSLH